MSDGADVARGAAGWPRPRLVSSACLELEACRYNGQAIRARFLTRLLPHVELVAVCPEVEIGLGVPRAPIRLVQIDGHQRLVQPATGRDVTGAMDAFAASWLDGLGDVDAFLLKSRSPSCGPKDVKVYAGNGIPGSERTPGRFAAAVAARYPLTPLEDEGRLTNYRLRHHFLTRLFQGARLRALPRTSAALVAFHASSKLLLLAHSESLARELGRVVANPDRLEPAEVWRRYADGFARALGRPPRTGALVNALQHAAGHFSTLLNAAEKRVFGELLAELQAGRGSFQAPAALLRGWLGRAPRSWLAGQSFLQPYPGELHELADSAGNAQAA